VNFITIYKQFQCRRNKDIESRFFTHKNTKLNENTLLERLKRRMGIQETRRGMQETRKKGRDVYYLEPFQKAKSPKNKLTNLGGWPVS